MFVSAVIQSAVFRIVFPVTLLVACLLRPSVLSLLYGLVALISLLLPSIRAAYGTPAATKTFLSVAIALIASAALAQTVYQIYGAAALTDEEYSKGCNDTTQAVLRQLGLARGSCTRYYYHKGHYLVILFISASADLCVQVTASTTTLPTWDAIRLLAPDYLSLVAALLTLILCVVFKTRPHSAIGGDRLAEPALPVQVPEPGAHDGPEVVTAPGSAATTPECIPAKKPGVGSETAFLLKRVSDVFAALFTFVVGTVHPSLLNSVYFLVALGLFTWWAGRRPLHRRHFNKIKLALLGYTVVHLTLLCLYQMPYLQDNIPSDGLPARLVGLTSVVRIWRCPSYWRMSIASTDVTWPMLLNPVLLLAYYVFMVVQYSVTRHGVSRRQDAGRGRDDLSSVHEEFAMSPMQRTPSPNGGKRHAKTPIEKQGRRAETGLGAQTPPSVNGSTPEHMAGKTKLLREEAGAQGASVDANANAAVGANGRRSTRLFSRNTTPTTGSTIGSTLMNVAAFVVYHCYAFSLVTMMLWAIFYHAFVSLVWLVLACVMWVMPNTRRAATLMSPLIVAYAEVLLVLTYIFSMQLPELPDDDLYEQIGLVKYSTGCVELWLKFVLMLPFFVTLRLYLRERAESQQSTNPAPVGGEVRRYGTFVSMVGHGNRMGPSTSMDSNFDPAMGPPRITGSVIGDLMSKYWIFAVSLVLLLVALYGPACLYSVGYLCLFGTLVTLLLLSFGLLRMVLFLYWTIVVAYSSAVILAVYLYQFPGVPGWWKNVTSLTKEWNDDIGLVDYSQQTGTLLGKLIGSIALFAVTILQLKFFHFSWIKVTDLKTAKESAAHEEHLASTRPQEEEDTQPDDSAWPYVRDCAVYTIEKIWLFLELHIWKLVALALILLATVEVCALNFVPVVLVSLALPMPVLSGLLAVIAGAFLTLVAAAKMLYQLHFVNEAEGEHVPMQCDPPSKYYSNESLAGWTGLRKIDNINDTSTSGGVIRHSMASYLAGYVLVLVLLAVMAIVRARQRYKRVMRGERQPPTVLFPEVTREDADKGFIQCAKYLANYAFFKFGVEICMSMTMLVAAVRMDAVAAVYVAALFGLLLASRRTLARVWWIYTIFLALVLPLQYCLAVGLPPIACIAYPWSSAVQDGTLCSQLGICWPNLIRYCFLPSYRTELAPNAMYLVADFFQLLFACCQLNVFAVEISLQADGYPGGSNAPISRDDELPSLTDNPVHDFITTKQSFLDMAKDGVFMYGHWVTIVMVFVAGLGGQSLFALGYLIAAFAFLWKGNDLYLAPLPAVRKQWRALAVYTVFVVLCKVVLQFLGCTMAAYIVRDQSDRWCVVGQLFSIACVGADTIGPPYAPYIDIPNPRCTLEQDEAKITYDLVCFIFLVAQLRILQTWYFQHVVLEYRAQRVLSSRGAILINQLIRKQMRDQQKAEVVAFEQIRSRTDEIRARYEKQRGEGDLVQMTDPPNYASAKRAGDYYMFDYDPDQEEDAALASSQSPREQDPAEQALEQDEATRGLGPGQMVHTAIEHNLDFDAALKGAERAEKVPVDARADAAVNRGYKGAHKSRSSSDVADVDDVVLAPPPFVDDDDEPVQQSWGEKIGGILRFARKLVESMLDKLAAYCNVTSRNYRYVAYVLHVEKHRLKQKMRHELTACAPKNFRQMRHDLLEGDFGKEIRCVETERDMEKMEDEAQGMWANKNVLARLLTAFGYVALSHTELLCYLLMVWDHASTAALITLPLPLLAFFWGTLCSPRPPKSYWIVTIAYTQCIVVIKFVFQFQFYPWNSKEDPSPFWPPRIIGVEKEDQFAAWDVVLLISLFFHRYVLRTLGLWKDAQRGAPNSDSAGSSAEATPSVMVESAIGQFGRHADDQPHGRRQAHQPIPESGTCSPEDENGGQAPEDAVRSAQLMAYFSGVIKFFHSVLHPSIRYISDLYPFMFLCDVVCLLIATFGYASFGVDAGTGNVLSDVTQSRVPLLFVVIVLVLTILMIIDRAIYLRKAVVAKLIFQYALVLACHLWVFFSLPDTTHQSVKKNTTVKIWYFVKCVYFLFSAWQIRNGYPRSSIGHLLMKSYSLVSMVLFKVFMLAPFIFELRTLIDWTWTDTSFPLFDYFNMEYVFAKMYELKCMRKFEADFPAPRGQPKPKFVKYIMGVPIIIIIVVLVFGPLLLYASLNHLGERSNMSVGGFKFSIDGYPSMFEMETRGSSLKPLDDSRYDQLRDMFSDDRSSLAFLEEYTAKDVWLVRFDRASTSDWSVSTPARDRLIEALNNTDAPLTARYSLSLGRKKNDASEEQSLHVEQEVRLEKRDSKGNLIYGDFRLQLVEALSNTTGGSGILPKVLAPFWIVPNEGSLKQADALLKGLAKGGKTVVSRESYLSQCDQTDAIKLSLELAVTNRQLQDCETLHPFGKRDGLTVVAFVDKMFPAIFKNIVGGGIIAMYTAIVLVVARLIRGVVIAEPTSFIITEIPYVDRVLKICRDIYVAREAKDFALEQDLFARLIFLFRSPETLVRWTRPRLKQE